MKRTETGPCLPLLIPPLACHVERGLSFAKPSSTAVETSLPPRSCKSGFAYRSCAVIFLTTAVVLSAALLVRHAEAQKNSKADKKDESVYAELTKAPKKARNRQNPLQHDPEAVAAGAKLFQQKCAECHGETAEGTRKAPSLLADEVQQATPGTLFWILTNGVVRRGMPVWSKLPEAQRWQLVTYIKSLSPSAANSEAAAKTKASQ
jgi:mono/diheme cytochrome c family protein